MTANTLLPGITSGLVGSGVLLVFLLFRRYLPPPRGLERYSLDELKAEFGSLWDLLGTAFWLASMAVITVGVFGLLYVVGGHVGPAPQAGGWVFRPLPLLYAFPGFLLALGGAWVPTLLLLRLSLGGRYPRFAAYSALKAKFNVLTVLVGGLLFMSLAAAVAAFLLLATYTVVDSSGIRFAHAGQLRERAYGYERVREIVRARMMIAGGREVDGPAFAVVFDDGNRLATTNVGFSMSADRQRDVMRHVARASGRHVRDVDLLEEYFGPGR